MLHRLEIENFYSIRDRQIIDLRADANAPNDAGRLAPLWKGAVEKAPKVVALFGANASGKSNVLKALAFITWFVRDSFSAPRGARMPFERFNDAEALQAPTSIAVHDVGPEWPAMPYSQEAKQCRYAYELTIGGGAQQVVEREALFYWPARARRRLTLFERDVSGEVSAVGEFDLKGYRQALGKILRPNASVIATLAQLDHPFSKRLWATISQVGGNILIEKQDGTDEYARK